MAAEIARLTDSAVSDAVRELVPSIDPLGQRDEAVWRRQLLALPSSHMSQRGKILALYLHDRKHRGDWREYAGPIKVWYPEIQESTGLSDGAVSGAVADLAAVGAVIKSDVRDGKGHKRVYLDLSYLDEPPALWSRDEQRRHGGHRRALDPSADSSSRQSPPPLEPTSDPVGDHASPLPHPTPTRVHIHPQDGGRDKGRQRREEDQRDEELQRHQEGEEAPPLRSRFIPGHIPEELIARRQWVCWTFEHDAGRWRKPPINPRTGKKAKTTIPSTWGTFGEALDGLARGAGKGIGFVLTHSDPYSVIDLDHCRDPDTREITAEAQAIIDRMDSYTELSPSGRGVHVLVQGRLPKGRRRFGQANMEMYDSGQYITMTGDRLPLAPATIEERKTALRTLHTALCKDDGADAHPGLAPVGQRTDRDVLLRARAARYGEHFSALWAGEWERFSYPSQSEADLALCGYLVYWSGNASQVDRLFRRSGLMRPKWDVSHASGRRTYGQRTIDRAMRNNRKHARR